MISAVNSFEARQGKFPEIKSPLTFYPLQRPISDYIKEYLVETININMRFALK